MSATREHLSGLELAINELRKAGVKSGTLPRMVLTNLIDQAQSAEPAQVEAVEVVAWRIKGDSSSPSIMTNGAALFNERNYPGSLAGREPLMTVAQHNRIMAAAKPDAELVELLRCASAYVLEHACTVGGEASHDLSDRIDAKLAEVNKQ
jgi:hypothetical protein